MKTENRIIFCNLIIFLTPIIGFWVIILIRIIISFSSQSILFLWVGLEVNILSALPLLASKDSFFSSEVRLKYFISQRVASVLFLTFYLCLRIFTSSFLSLLVTLFIVFKLGLPPFHRWLSSIAMVSPLKQLWIILFVQKFIPLQILTNLLIPYNFLILILIITSLLCFFCRKNIRRIRIMLLISAWVNTAWLIVSLGRFNAWFLFLLIYGWLLKVALTLAQEYNSIKLSSLMLMPIVIKLIWSFNFLNLAGLPPFTGFFIKLYILKYAVINYSFRVILVLLFISLVVLYAYSSIFYYFIRSNISSAKANLNFIGNLTYINMTSRWISLPLFFSCLS